MTEDSYYSFVGAIALLWFPYLFLVLWLADRAKSERAFWWLWLSAYPVVCGILLVVLKPAGSL